MQPDETTARIIADIEQRGLSKLADKWGVVPQGDERRQKYLDLARWIPANLQRVKAIGLDTGERCRVLDLGCGCGYFLYLCNLFGHETLGIDRTERNSLFVDARELLGVRWTGHTIRYGQPLPVDGVWDVVTAHMVTFNGHRVKPWGVPEWEWLIESIPARRWYLELNAEPDGTLFPPGLRGWFLEQGARIRDHRVMLPRPQVTSGA